MLPARYDDDDDISWSFLEVSLVGGGGSSELRVEDSWSSSKIQAPWSEKVSGVLIPRLSRK